MIIYDSNINSDDLKAYGIQIDEHARIGKNVKIGYGCVIFGKTEIGDDCEIGDNSRITNSILGKEVKVLFSFVEDSTIGDKTSVGPYATIKKGSVISAECRIGNFVEIKNSNIGFKTKVAHLAYVGDADIGSECNVGCGVVFCNYNGLIKQRSIVGDRVFIGSNVNIIAPVKIDNNSYVAAGGTINKDIEKNQFSIARSEQINKNNFNNPYLKKYEKNQKNS